MMPYRTPKLCNAAGCGELTTDAYCTKHKRIKRESGWEIYHGGRDRHQRGYGTYWEKLRRVVLTRDSLLCQPCLNGGRLTVASQVDHIIPKGNGGTDDVENLQAICVMCHRLKTARESQRG